MKYLAITAILCLVLAGASFAGNVTMTEVITGGNLTLTMPNNFTLSTKTLGGFSSSVVMQSDVKSYSVEDSRGTGAGWNVGFQMSQFVTAGTSPRTIGTDKFEMELDDTYIGAEYGQSKDNTYGPKSLIDNPTNITSAEVKAVTAAEGYGMGKYLLYNTSHKLTINAYVYAGTYTATLTATLNNTP